MHNLIGQVAKKNLRPPFLSCKSHISSFSAISAQSWLCFPSKTRTFPNNPFLSKLIHKLVWISPQKIMIAVQKVYWRCRHPTSKITILVPWFLPWISQWLLPFNGFCHVIEPCIVPWVLPRISLWVLPCDGLCHMSEPSLVTWVLACSWPFFGLKMAPPHLALFQKFIRFGIFRILIFFNVGPNWPAWMK